LKAYLTDVHNRLDNVIKVLQSRMQRHAAVLRYFCGACPMYIVHFSKFVKIN